MMYMMTEQEHAQIVDALNRVDAVNRGMVTTNAHKYAARDETIEALAMLKAMQPVEQKPIAWMYIEATFIEGDLRGRGWKFNQFSRTEPDRPWMQRDVVELFDHPVMRPVSDDALRSAQSDLILEKAWRVKFQTANKMLLEALKELSHAVSEIHHARANPRWFTGGEHAAYQHQITWIGKATEIVATKARAAINQAEKGATP